MRIAKWSVNNSFHSILVDCVSHLAQNTDQVLETHNNSVSEARAPHEIAKVFANPRQLCVLPTWSHHARPVQPIETTLFEHSSGKKRFAATIEVHLDLPYKRQ